MHKEYLNITKWHYVTNKLCRSKKKDLRISENMIFFKRSVMLKGINSESEDTSQNNITKNVMFKIFLCAFS